MDKTADFENRDQTNKPVENRSVEPKCDPTGFLIFAQNAAFVAKRTLAFSLHSSVLHPGNTLEPPPSSPPLSPLAISYHACSLQLELPAHPPFQPPPRSQVLWKSLTVASSWSQLGDSHSPVRREVSSRRRHPCSTLPPQPLSLLPPALHSFLSSTNPRCLPGYPFKCPKLQISPENGLSESDTDKLLSLLRDQI
ncbi:uncharacterized protein LOC107643604 [Arachis ipaensis]|uniref:uncharacterized protein LOC107643604 n=1 Tax=Arachis ipaensis TaxID=130454 RepID=UPI000A2B380E|nr:uncharacterized protein LOC107643604 [Arachis ipaensis]